MPVQTRSQTRKIAEQKANTCLNTEYRGFTINGSVDRDDAIYKIDNFLEYCNSIMNAKNTIRTHFKTLIKEPVDLEESKTMIRLVEKKIQYYGENITKQIFEDIFSVCVVAIKYILSIIDSKESTEKLELSRIVFTASYTIMPFLLRYYPDDKHTRVQASKVIELIKDSGIAYGILFLAEYFSEICNENIRPIRCKSYKHYKRENEYDYANDPFWGPIWKKHGHLVTMDL